MLWGTSPAYVVESDELFDGDDEIDVEEESPLCEVLVEVESDVDAESDLEEMTEP